MDSTKEDLVKDELDRAISLGAVAAWLKEKFPSRAEEYVARADKALTTAVQILKTRTQPTLV